MSPDRHGSGATRIEADLSIKRGEKDLMRRASTCLAVLGLALLALPGVASATPKVTFKAEAVPIPGFPHTGDILGAGTALKAEYTIEGTEYLGSPPPPIGINFYLPKGAVLHSGGFPTCSEEVLKQSGPIGCPKGSQAGPVGMAEGFVSLGGERVEEPAEIFSFYNSAGGFLFLTVGHSPVSLEILSPGRYVNLGGAGGYGPELITKIPEIASLPGAPFASVKTIKVKAGSAVKSHGKAIYYGRVPTKCPKGGFPLKTVMQFGNVNNPKEPGEKAEASYKAPCPKK